MCESDLRLKLMMCVLWCLWVGVMLWNGFMISIKSLDDKDNFDITCNDLLFNLWFPVNEINLLRFYTWIDV